MKKLILFLILSCLILLSCNKEKKLTTIKQQIFPLICNTNELNQDSVLYVKFDSSIIFKTKTGFNSSDSLFYDTIRLDIDLDDRIDFIFFYSEVFTKGIYYHNIDSLYKFIKKQVVRVTAKNKYNSPVDYYFLLDIKMLNDMVDTVNISNWSQYNDTLTQYDLIKFNCNVFMPEVTEWFLPFMFRKGNEPRYGWIRFRVTIIVNSYSVYPFKESKIKFEILDYAYQNF